MKSIGLKRSIFIRKPPSTMSTRKWVSIIVPIYTTAEDHTFPWCIATHNEVKGQSHAIHGYMVWSEYFLEVYWYICIYIFLSFMRPTPSTLVWSISPKLMLLNVGQVSNSQEFWFITVMSTVWLIQMDFSLLYPNQTNSMHWSDDQQSMMGRHSFMLCIVYYTL